MRAKPLIGRKAWFGPRRLGWGWSPVTAEGWTVLVVGVGGVIVLAAAVPHALWASLVVAVVTLAIIILKGASPGGPTERRKFRAVQNRES